MRGRRRRRPAVVTLIGCAANQSSATSLASTVCVVPGSAIAEPGQVWSPCSIA